MSDFQISVVPAEKMRHLAVLRIASSAQNTTTQLYKERIQVSAPNIADLDAKLRRKLLLHRIAEVGSSLTIQFESDKAVVFNDVSAFQKHDLQVDVLTQSVSVKWSFVFDADGDGQEHLHTILVRISERPHPGMVLQKMLSATPDDVDGVDTDLFSPIACKIDFTDSRFSAEVLAVVSEWVAAQPKAVPTFSIVSKLHKNGEEITGFIYGTFPAVAVSAYVGVWLSFVPDVFTSSTKYATVWILGGGVLFLLARYVAIWLNSAFARHVQRICKVPVFQLTSGDKNRMTTYLAKSQRSLIALGFGAIVYGGLKATGFYLATLILTRWGSN
jgi:hypothetical protein